MELSLEQLAARVAVELKWKDTGITPVKYQPDLPTEAGTVNNFGMSAFLALLTGVTPKPFAINCYLKETYSFTSYTAEGTSCLASILTAFLKKEVNEVIDLCLWTLASFKTTLLEDADGEPCSFVQKLGTKALITSEPRAYPTDPAMEEWATAASKEPGFEVFTLALAMFVIGFPKRKPVSRENLSRHGKWKHLLAAMSSFKRPLPKKIKLNSLKDANLLNDFVKQAACGACLFLEGTILGRKLREPIVFGIQRPVCDNHTLLRQRFQEFKKLYPEALFRDSKFPTLPEAARGLELLARLEKVLTEATDANAALQPLMIRSIDRGYLCFLGDETVKRFQSYLFYCICNRKGRRGRENWQAFIQVHEKNPKAPKLWGLKRYDDWVSSLRVK